ncbi:TPA_asm: hypothetical protein vir335_00055 [Classicovirus victor]|uniref:Uncharacterized protein n=1 Tax=Caudoviricetes sp. vir335 TaxID=3068357 RepID=A0AA86YAQ5_9CAUD|nr:TPA_asm: hypothetical protein vir335_00055 [Caudoviricetes sp. vir335]
MMGDEEMKNGGDGLPPRVMETLNRIFRTELAMTFLKNIDKFGMYAKYYDMDSMELLDEKYEVLQQLAAGKSRDEIPGFYDILEGLQKVPMGAKR